MIYKRKLIFIWMSYLFLSLIMIAHAHAGWYASTAHSRANCYGFNESITWNWTEYHWWKVISLHFRVHGSGFDHKTDAWMAYTWRAAAFHMGEWEGDKANNWRVQGYHFYMRNDGVVIYDAYTQSVDCNMYDGWWDKPHARGELKSEGNTL